MALDGRTHTGFRKFKTKDHGNTVSSTLQLRLSNRNNNRREHKRPRGNLMARTTERNTKTHRFCKSFPIRHRKKYAINELELLAVVWGLEHFRLYIYGKPIKLLTEHQALEPLIKRNRSNKTYSARVTRWLDRLAHFPFNVNHIAGKHLALTEYLTRNPVIPPHADDTYDEEYVINNIIPHYSFISKYGCLSNHTSQSENGTEKSERKSNNEPLTNDTRKQTAIDCLYSDVHTTGEENNFENFELDLISYLSSSTELEADIKHEEEEETIRRSKRLTKTNPIVRYNSPVCHDYRKHRRKAELGSNTESNGNGNKQPQLVHTTDSKLTSRINAHRDNHTSEDRVSVHKQLDHWRDYRHTVEEQNPIGRTSANSERGNVESADNF